MTRHNFSKNFYIETVMKGQKENEEKSNDESVTCLEQRNQRNQRNQRSNYFRYSRIFW